MSQTFFGEKRPAAVLKHGLLSRYLPVYVLKTGSRSKGGRVAYIDAYAGPGRYVDGSKGSPAVAVETAKRVRDHRQGDRIDAYFIEDNGQSAEALRTYIADEGLDWSVTRGKVQHELPKLLARIDPDTSLFVFLDPFGLGVSMDLLRQILKRGGRMQGGYRTGGAATEILLNFSYPGLRRNAGHLLSDKTDRTYLEKTRPTFISKLNHTLGGTWWQQIWEDEHDDDRRGDLILNGYLQHLAKLPGQYGWWHVPVSNSWRGKPLYELVHLTQHDDGQWAFHEALSNSLEEYRSACLEGELDYEGPLQNQWPDWIAEIEANIDLLLARGRSFVVQDHMTEVYGNVLGLARERHVKQAIKNLHAQSRTGCTGVGPVQKMLVTPPTQLALAVS